MTGPKNKLYIKRRHDARRLTRFSTYEQGHPLDLWEVRYNRVLVASISKCKNPRTRYHGFLVYFILGLKDGPFYFFAESVDEAFDLVKNYYKRWKELFGYDEYDRSRKITESNQSRKND